MNRRLPTALILLALAAAPVAAAPRRAPQPVVPVGKPLDCVPINQIRETRVRDERTIDFFVGGKVYRNTLPNRCPELDADRAFSYSTSLSRLCSVDIITVLRTSPFLQRGAGCGLGAFQEVKGVRR